MSEFDAARFGTRQLGGLVIVDVSGRLQAGESTRMLHAVIKELAGAGHKNVLLNLGDTSYVDSAGIGEMVSACTHLRNLGGDMRLFSPQPRVAHLFEITKVNYLFAIFADEQTAVASFPAAAANG
jgi:anti-sigma B factor antagonist